MAELKQSHRIFHKYRPFSAHNYSTSEKQFLVCYWDLVGTKPLPGWPRVSMQPEILIMKGVLSAQHNPHAECEQQ